MGATACGKTDLSLSLATLLDAEIINVDSALVYRGMDIGTAKPSADERAQVVHHLIDICDPWQTYSAAQFCKDANDLINEIHTRGKRALLTGGTMLYFKALEEGLAELPEASPAVRAELAREAADSGWPALHEKLASVDPRAAQRIHPNDPQRLQRALEVHQLTGKPLSDLQDSTRSLLEIAPVKFALIPSQRAWLHQRIEQRFQLMLEEGFIDEVIKLRKDCRINAALPAMRSVGYRQAWEYLENQNRPLHASEDDTVWVQKALAATRQLAKRQLTWMRSMNNIVPIECDELSPQQQIDIVVKHTERLR